VKTIKLSELKKIEKRDRLRLLGLRAFLIDNPDKHDQASWAEVSESEFDPDHIDLNFTCGTTACAAGWANVLCGDRFSKEGKVSAWRADPRWHVRYVVDSNGKTHSMGDRARNHLGISKKVAIALFDGSNTRKSVLKALKMLAEGSTDRKVIKYLTTKNPSIVTDPISLTEIQL